MAPIKKIDATALQSANKSKRSGVKNGHSDGNGFSHGSDDGISNDTTIHSAAILDPMTGDSLTLAQAIGCGLIDLNNGQFIDPCSDRRMSLQEAAEKGFIDPALLHRLKNPCGLVDPHTGKELSLLDAIRKGYYDLSKGVFIHPETGKPLSPEEALHLGLSTKEKVRELFLFPLGSY